MNKKDLDSFEKKIEDSINKDTLLDSEVVEVDVSDYDLSTNSTKDKISKLPWLVAFFLIVIISITACAMFLNSNPQTIFTMAIDKFFSSITENISENAYNISKGNIKINFDVNSNDENSSLYNELSKNSFDINYKLDSSNERSYFKINMDYKEEKSLSMNLYNDRNSMYVYYDDVFDKYIKYEKDNSYSFIKSNDYKLILNGLNQAFDKVVTSEKISVTKTNLDYDIKTLKVYESKLLIDGSNYKRVSDTFVNSLKSNEEFISTLSNILNLSSSDTKVKLDRLCDKLKKYFTECGKSEVKLFIDRRSHNFIKGIFSSSLGSFELLNKDNAYDFKLDDYNGSKIDGSIETTVNNKKTNYDINFIINILNNEKKYSGKFNIVFTNKKASSFGKVNLKDYVKNGDLSEIEKLELYSKLLEKPSFKALSQFIK